MVDTLKYYHRQLRDTLLNNFVPFWEQFSPDPLYGGFLCGFDRDGGLFYEDKSVWQQGRSLWMFSKLFNDVEPKQGWLDIAKSGYDFINSYCFDEKGHMYFRITRDGKPLVSRRYYFSEAFAIMGYAEYYQATGKPEVKSRAIDVFNRMLRYYTTPGYFPPKVDPHTRRNKSHSIIMIMLNVCQAMRTIDDNPRYEEIISDCIHQLLTQFLKEDEQALLETVGPNGERVDSSEGRLVNPGHSLETAWFLMHEAVHRKNRVLMEHAIQICRWSLRRGWDDTMGGIYYFVDVEDKPVLSLEWDMKLLWPHCEALIALLYAYWYMNDAQDLQWFEQVANYMYSHFPDKGHPEWYGHLHRDGTPINTIKGSDWKGPFHNVRAFMQLTDMLNSMMKGKALFS